MDKNGFHIPEKCRDFTVFVHDMPEVSYFEALFDIPTRTILINSAADPGVNVVWLRVNPALGAGGLRGSDR